MKIFGIGLSKTGTTSLTQALEILGYKAIHNPSYLLNYQDDVLSLNYAEVSQYDVLTDIQIARFYKELDLKYPGSKFILTTREMKSWLRSCENHFNRFRDTSDKARALDIAMYGTDLFDGEKLRNAYDRYYDDVMEYFQGRDSDLLILDVLEANKWQKICDFLDKPIPRAEYPMINKAVAIPVCIKNLVRRFSFARKVIRALKRKHEK